MFGIFTEKVTCPSCKEKIQSNKIRISRHRAIQVFTCPSCKADFVKNKRAELFPVLEEGVVLV